MLKYQKLSLNITKNVIDTFWISLYNDNRMHLSKNRIVRVLWGIVQFL